MTEKLYYNDAYLREFSAQIEAIRATERGTAVRLDKTAFYPTGGGQAHDSGTLDEIPVLDVWTDEAGEVWHLLETAPTAETVRGRIDWQRRFDHMQLHTGQHLLTAAFIHEFDAPTLSCHLGSEASTIDLPLPQVSWEEAFHVETCVNRIIWENRPITARFVTDEELSTICLRHEPKVEGPIRIVSVEGYDDTPCGGTHTHRTGEVGLVKITALERYKGGVRVTFLCGERALKDYRQTLQLLQQLGKTLSVGPNELPDAVTRIQQEAKETQRDLKKAAAALRDLETEKLWAEAPSINGVKRVVARWTDRPFSDVQAVATRLRSHAGTLILLAAQEQEAVRLICARSDDVTEVDASAIVRAAAEALGGRGGGSPAMAQGGGTAPSSEAVEAALRKALSEI